MRHHRSLLPRIMIILRVSVKIEIVRRSEVGRPVPGSAYSCRTTARSRKSQGYCRFERANPSKRGVDAITRPERELSRE